MKKNGKPWYVRGITVFAIAAACILFYFFVDRFQGFRGALYVIMKIIRPFIFGAVMAYLLFPVRRMVSRLLQKCLKIPRNGKKGEKARKRCDAAGTVLSLVLMFLVFYSLCAMLLPELYQSVLMLANNMPRYIRSAETLIADLLERYPILQEWTQTSAEEAFSAVENVLSTNILPRLNAMLGNLSSGVVNALVVFKDFFIGIIIAVYIMSGYTTFRRQFKEVVLACFPYKWDRPVTEEQFADWLFRQIRILNNLTGGFVKGKLLDSLIIGLICAAFCIPVNMPYALLVSVVVGITNIIPFFGPFIGAVPCAVLILIIDPKMCVIFVVFIFVLQQLDGNIIGPKILGNTTNLSSFWVLFAVLFFGGLMGVTGMLIGVPLFGFIYQLISEAVHKKNKTHRELLNKYLDEAELAEAEREEAERLHEASEV